jgi:tetratricopeptide (TPR) repeat protein
LENRSWRNLIGFAVVTFGAAMVHPITLLQAMILSGGFGLIYFLFNRSQRVFVNLAIIGVVFLISTVIPFLQYLRFSNYMPIELIGLGDAVEFGRLTSAVGRYRLWLLAGERFTLHPSVILEPVIIAAYILLPFIIYQARKHNAARLFLGTLILLPVLLYIPIFAALVGRVVTPFLIWRLAWPLHLFSILTIGWGLWFLSLKLIEQIRSTRVRSFFSAIVPALLVSLTIIFAFSTIKSGFNEYRSRKDEINLTACVTAKDVLTQLSELSIEESINVLSSPRVNICVPGYAPLANVVEFRGLGTVNRLSEDNLAESMQRLEDVNYFKIANYLDDLLLDAITRHNIDYVLVQKDNMELDYQFRYSTADFLSVYEDDDYHLYKVIGPLNSNRVIEGNTALRQRQYGDALQIFTQILKEEPTNILAHLGLGLTLEGLGEPESAVIAFEDALAYAPDEPALHTQLANTHVLMKNFDKAVREYQLAVQLAPERDGTQLALGKLLVVIGQEETARHNFERIAATRADKDTALYYSILGHFQYSANMISDAIESYEKAISLEDDPQNYIDLANVLAISGDVNKAVENYKNAIELDRWNYLPHLYLGHIYLDQNRNEDAIAELEIACRLKPTNIAGYILLGQAIKAESGLEAAHARLEELQSVNSVLPGPYRSIATLAASNKEYEGAIQALANNAHIQPNNATILTAIGYISLANNQLEPAYEAFEQALNKNPNLISARLGLSQYYRTEADYEKEAGQLLHIIRLAPTLAWSHLKLAETYSRQGEWDAAQEQLDWALELDPENIGGYISRANISVNKKDWESALLDYRKVLELEPENHLALLGLGNVYFQLADYSNAQTIFERVVNLDEELIYPRMKLAEMYWYHGLFEEAIALEETTVMLDPDSEQAKIKLADIYRLLGRNEEARSMYEQVVQIDSGAVLAYSALAELAAEQGADYNSLHAFYTAAITANPESAEANLALGQYLFEQGQIDLAEQTLKDALSLDDVAPGNYLQLSILQDQRGNAEEALGTLQTMVDEFPDNASAHSYLANFLLNLGDLNQAEKYFLMAIELNPEHISAYSGLSQTKLEMGDSEEAQRILQEAITTNPDSVEAYLSMASLQETLGELTRAEEYFKEVANLIPADFRIYKSRGEFYARQGDFDAALTEFQYALSLPGPKLELFLDVADLYMAMDQADDARHWYLDAVDLDRGDPSPFLALANYYQVLDKPEEALIALNEAYNIRPNNFAVNFALGNLHQKLSNFDEAENYLRQASEIDLTEEKSLIALAELKQNMGQLPEAIAYAQEAIKVAPTNMMAYDLLGQTYALSGDGTEAENAYTEGIARSSSKQDAYMVRADYYKSQGMWEHAEADYKTAFDIAPDSQQAGLALARFHHDRGNFDKALLVLHRLEEKIEPDAEVKIKFGNIYTSIANWDMAEDAFNDAIEIDKTNVDGYIGLARIYELQGDMELALQTYQGYFDHAPDDPEALIALGNAYMDRGEYSVANTALLIALEINPMNKTAMAMLNEIGNITGSQGLDIAVILDRLDQMPSVDSYITLANYYQLKGDLSATHYLLQAALQIEPYNSDIWFDLGNYYRMVEEWDLALDTYNTALNYDYNPSRTLQAIGSVQEELGMVNQAIASYQQAIEFAPASIQGYQSLADLQYRSGNVEESLVTIQSGIKNVPSDPLGYQTLGDIHADLGNITQANEAYQEGLNIIPGAADLYVSLGDQQINQVLEARERLEYTESLELWARYQVERIQEQSATAQTRSEKRVSALKLEDISEVYGSIHNRYLAAQRAFEQTSTYFETSEAYYQKALNLQPVNEYALLGLGKLHLAAGAPEIALGYFQKGSESNPQSLISLGYLGNTYLNLDLPKEAIIAFEKMLEYDQDNLLAHLGISRAHQEMDQIDIHEAAESADHWQFRMKALSDFYRMVEQREVLSTVE